MDERKHLLDYHVTHGSTIQNSVTLGPVSPLIPITVRVVNEETSYTLDVNRSDSVGDIKAKLCKLHHTTNDTELIILRKLSVQYLDDHELLINCLNGNGIEHTLYFHVGLREDCVDKKVYVQYQYPSKGLHSIPVSISDTLEELKYAVYQFQGIPPQWQWITYDGKLLGDMTKTLLHYGIFACGRLLKVDIRRRSYHVAQKIFVKPLTGNYITLAVDPSDTISHLKILVCFKTGLPPQIQRLIYAGMQLEDDMSLDEYGVDNESTLHLVTRIPVPEVNKIFVANPTGKKIELAVSPLHPIRHIKLLIYKLTTFPPNSQILLFFGKVLKDDTILQNLYVRDQSTLQLIIRKQVVKKIFVNMLTGGKFTLAVDPLDTIEHVKSLIYNKTGIPPKLQRLIYVLKELQDDITLQEYHVMDESILCLVIQDFKILQPYDSSLIGWRFLPQEMLVLPLIIKVMNGQCIKIFMNTSTEILVDEVKTSICVETAIPKSLQILKHDGHALDDNKSLSDYGVCPLDIIDLLISLPAKCSQRTELAYQTLNGKLPKHVAVCIKTLKTLKFWLVSSITNTPPITGGAMGLGITATELEDGKTEFKRSSLTVDGVRRRQSKAYIDLRTAINVKINSRMIFPINVNPWSNLYEMEVILPHIVPQDVFRLVYRGVILQKTDASVIEDYNIENNSTILVTTPPPRGSMRIFIVETGTWDTYMLSVDSSDTLRNTKQQIQEQFGVSANHQQLAYNDQVVENHRTLFDYKIQHESALTLHILPHLPDEQLIEISVNTNLGNFRLLSDDSDRICELKSKVLSHQFEQNNLMSEQLSLGNSETGSKHSINRSKGTSITFYQFQRPEPIYIEIPTLQKLTVDAIATDNITHIMEKLDKKRHLHGRL